MFQGLDGWHVEIMRSDPRDCTNFVFGAKCGDYPGWGGFGG